MKKLNFYDALFLGTGILGVAGVFTAKYIQLFQHPEWTETLALINLWHIYLPAAISIISTVMWFTQKPQH